MKATTPLASTPASHHCAQVKLLEALHYQEAMSCIDHTKRHLILFDIDDNLISTTDLNTPYSKQTDTSRVNRCGPGSDSWFKHMLSTGYHIKALITLYDSLQSHVKMQSVEPDCHYQLPDQTDYNHHHKLQGLIDKGHLILAITSRGPKTAGNTEYHLRHCGFNLRQMHQTNLNVSHQTPQWFAFKNSQKLVHHNIIYCEGANKGQVLNAFLKNSRYGQQLVKKGFERIFFMDDDKKKCLSVMQAASQLNCPITAVHYTFVKNNYQQYDQQTPSNLTQHQQKVQYYQRLFGSPVSRTMDHDTKKNQSVLPKKRLK